MKEGCCRRLMAYVRFLEKSISQTYPRISSLCFACTCHIQAQGIAIGFAELLGTLASEHGMAPKVKFQNRFMGSYSEDMAFILSQNQIQDLGITADTPNIHPSMLAYVLNQRHFIQSYGNMLATQDNMPANHGNVQPIHANLQAIHGPMQAIHAYNDWHMHLFDRMGGEEL
ncbi:uncharacterized protein [Pocillopora verrucosa]|uniref:uncharacterized protein isoform X2 n=1 Tax=Pocillopora verrucosa TaxID=203993 RepID=UPI00333E42D5